MKYMIVECKFSYAVALDEDGRFLKVANRNYTVGQYTDEVTELKAPEAAPIKKRNRLTAAISAVAACLVIAAGSLIYADRLPYASVYMAINPEVRIDVNKRDMVVGLEGVNEDGIQLIDEYNYKHKDIDVVMDELVDRAVDQGFLHEGGQISVTVDGDNDEWVVAHEDHIAVHLNEHFNVTVGEKMAVTIEIAHKAGVVHSHENHYGDSDYAPVTVQPEKTQAPTAAPTAEPTEESTAKPTKKPEVKPTEKPTEKPTAKPAEKTEETKAPAKPSESKDKYEGMTDYDDRDDDGRTDYDDDRDDDDDDRDDDDDDRDDRDDRDDDDGRTDYDD